MQYIHRFHKFIEGVIFETGAVSHFLSWGDDKGLPSNIENAPGLIS